MAVGLAIPSAQAMEVFGGEHPAAAEHFPGFAAMAERYGDQLRQAAATCETGSSNLCDAIAAWQAMIEEVAALEPAQRLEAVNAHINGFAYTTDDINWQAVDYWATPLEFFAFSGDCEDIAIAKYYTLRGLGYPASAMRVVVVVDEYSDRMHTVLAVQAGGEVFILDNEVLQVLPARSFGYLVPQMSVNELGVWTYPTTNLAYARQAGAMPGNHLR